MKSASVPGEETRRGRMRKTGAGVGWVDGWMGSGWWVGGARRLARSMNFIQ